MNAGDAEQPVGRRYLAGFTEGYPLDEAALQVLAKAGAQVERHYPKLDLAVLRIAAPDEFRAPSFVVFLEAESEVREADGDAAA